MDELIIIGKTVSTHGVKGELKVISDFDHYDLAFKVGNEIMINNVMHKISSIRYHKQYILMTIDDLYDINEILKYVGFNIYIYRSSLNLSEDDYLLDDLIDSDVIEDNESIGKVIEVINGVSSDLIKVKGIKEFLIPLVDEYIIKFDKNKKMLYTKNAKNLIL